MVIDIQGIKFKKMSKDAKTPTQAYEGDAGWDLYSVEDIILLPNTTTEVHTHISMEIPQGIFGLITARSSQGKIGIRIHPGIVDSGYRYECSPFIQNLTLAPYEIKKGDKICQMIFQPYAIPKQGMIEVEELSKSERGIKGHGSSGR